MKNYLLKNYIRVIILFTLGNNSLLSQGNLKNDVSEYELKGKVKFFKEVSYKVSESFGEIKINGTGGRGLFGFDKIILFNYKGFETQVQPLTDKGESIYIMKNYYDSNDSLIKVEGYNNGKLAFYSISKYTKYRKKTTSYENNKIQEVIVKELDSKGNLIEYSKFGKDGKLEKRELLSYDSKGNCIEKKEYYPKEDFRNGHSTYTYNSRNKITEEKEYDSSGRIVSSTISKYNFFGRLTEEQHYTGKRFAFRYLYKYNKVGKVSEQLTDFKSSGNANEKKIFKYNSRNDLQEKRTTTTKGFQSLVTYRYTYDRKGNWTKRILYINGEANTMLKREIKYY